MGDNIFNDNSITALQHLFLSAHHNGSPPDANDDSPCCRMCGFLHLSNGPHDAPTQCEKGQMGGKKGGDSGGKGSSGNRGSKGGQDKGNSGNGGGDKGSNRGGQGRKGGDKGRGAGDADSGSDSDSDSGGRKVPGPGGKYMNVDDPNVTYVSFQYYLLKKFYLQKFKVILA